MSVALGTRRTRAVHYPNGISPPRRSVGGETGRGREDWVEHRRLRGRRANPERGGRVFRRLGRLPGFPRSWTIDHSAKEFEVMSSSPFHVLVVGGGIGGLCLAQGLKRAGVSVAVYERDRTPTEKATAFTSTRPAAGRCASACSPRCGRSSSPPPASPVTSASLPRG